MSKESKERQLKKEAPPFCCDCAYFMPQSACEKCQSSPPPQCGLAKMIDIVTGKTFNAPCNDFRHPEAPCGQSALLFKPKDDMCKISKPPSVQDN